MKTIIALLSLAMMVSCAQPYAKIDVQDDKSQMVAKIFDEVSAERIDYLKEVFSDSMKMVNAKEMSFDKTEFIAGIEDMFDLFDDISFEAVDGDANGSEIETNYYANGRVWTSVWNNFSATGAYTGQKINFPFHLSYLWDGNQIIEEYQFFDLSQFENEANARASMNNTNTKVGFVIELGINKGHTPEDVKAMLTKFTTFMRLNEPDGYDYGYYISDDGKNVTLIEKYCTSEAALLHADNFENGPNIEPFMNAFSINSFVLFGNPSEELKARTKAYGAEHRALIGGWTN